MTCIDKGINDIDFFISDHEKKETAVSVTEFYLEKVFRIKLFYKNMFSTSVVS
jgi:hypothetical protein